MGACFGFLWWNASPAKIFMGDTGSLALGGALAGLAITTQTELLLCSRWTVRADHAVRGDPGRFFKMTGRRVFRMAPLQHHFELAGWGEVTIVIRFWIIAGLFVALGLGVFYAEWVATSERRHGTSPAGGRGPGPPRRGLVGAAGGRGRDRASRGFAAADALAERGAAVVAVDGRDGGRERERALVLDTLGVDVRLGPDARRAYCPRSQGRAPELVVTSPGWRPGPAAAGGGGPGRRAGLGRGRARLADACPHRRGTPG
jgi:hypothetical protein